MKVFDKTRAKPKAKPQHRTVIFLDEPLFRIVQAAAIKDGTSVTQLVAQLAAKRFGYKAQMRPRKFKNAA